MKIKQKRVAAVMMVIVMLITMPNLSVCTRAANEMPYNTNLDYSFDISKGDITIEDGFDGKIIIVKQGTDSTEVDSSQPISITSSIQNSSNGHSIDVTAKNPVTIRLKNASINTADNANENSKSALALGSSSDVTLIAEGTNILSSSDNYAGIRVPEGAKMTINGTSSADIVYAFGHGEAAGIGGNKGEACGDIVVNNYITAKADREDISGIGDGTAGNKMSGTIYLDGLYYLKNTTLGEGGNYIYTSPLAEMIQELTTLVYTGEDLTKQAEKNFYIDTEHEYSTKICGQTFKVEFNPVYLNDWNFSINPFEVKESGNYTVSYMRKDGKAIAKTFSVEKAFMDLTDRVKTDKEEYLLGEIITVTVTPKHSIMGTIEEQMVVMNYSNEVSNRASLADNVYTMTIDTEEAGFLIDEGAVKEIPLKVKLITKNSDNIYSNEITIKVKIRNAEAKITKTDGSISYAAKLKEAFIDENNGARITLLKNVTLNSRTKITIENGNFTLDLNGKTITQKYDKYAISLNNDANLTIEDTMEGGKIISNFSSSSGSFGILGNGSGTITVEGGTIEGLADNAYGIKGNAIQISGNAEIKGGLAGVYATGMTTISDHVKLYGNTCGLLCGSEKVFLSGGTFSGGIYAISIKEELEKKVSVSQLLAHTDTTRYAYYCDDDLMTEDLDTSYLTKTVTVKPCEHTYEVTDNKNGTHNKFCPACGKTENERCTYEYTKTEKFHTGTCSVCQAAAEQEEHQFGNWQKEDNDDNSYKRICQTCGYSQELVITMLENTTIEYGKTQEFMAKAEGIEETIRYQWFIEKENGTVDSEGNPSYDKIIIPDAVNASYMPPVDSLLLGENKFFLNVMIGTSEIEIENAVTVTVVPANIENAVVNLDTDQFVYNGQEQNSDITVLFHGETLTEDNYEIKYDNNINAGTAVVTVTGKGNYTGTVKKDFTIQKADLTIMGAAAVNRKYNGTAQVEISDVIFDGKIRGDDVSLVMENLMGTVKSSSAGSYSDITLPDKLVLTGKDAENYNLIPFVNNVSLTKEVIIEKLQAPMISSINKSYINTIGTKGETDKIAIAGLLPEDRGITAYQVNSNASYIMDTTIDNDGNLTYKVENNGEAGDKASLIITAKTDNYETITITVDITLMDQLVPNQKQGAEVKITGNNVLVYGSRLDSLKLEGEFEINNEEISGVLTWTNPSEIPYVGTEKAEWTFYPKESELYKEVKGELAIIVIKKDCEHIHTEIKNAEDSTCEKEGYTGDNYCIDCNEKLTSGTVVSKLKHDYDSKVTKEPTIQEEGIKTYTCKRCGDSYMEIIAKLENDTSSGNIGSGSTSRPGSTSNTGNTMKPDNNKPDNKPDDTKQEEPTETKQEESKTETTTETKPDGSKKETVTETKPDGSKKETITETKLDGSKKETITETKPDGSISEIKKVQMDNNAVLTLTKTISAEGKTVIDTVIRTGNINTDNYINIAEELFQEVAEYNKTGKVIVEITDTAIEAAHVSLENNNTMIITLNFPALSYEKVEKIILTKESIEAAKETGKKLVIAINTQDQKTENNYQIEIPAKQLAKMEEESDIMISACAMTELADVSKKEIFTDIISQSGGKKKKTGIVSVAESKEKDVGIKMYIPVEKAAGVPIGEYVYIYKYNHDTKTLEEISYSYQKVSESGMIMIMANFGTEYVLSAKKLKGKQVKTIEDSISISVSKKNIKVGKTTKVKVKLPKIVSKKKVFGQETVKISYQSKNKKVATVSKSGTITAKKKGTVIITIKIKLEGGQEIIKKKKITIK